MLYKKILRPILFKISPVNAYVLAMKVLHAIRSTFVSRKLFDMAYKTENISLSKNVMGLDFPNPVGLAAGLDKNAVYYNDLGACGFGFVEIGTLTPKKHESPEFYDFTKIHSKKTILSNVGIANNGVLQAIWNIKNEHPNVLLGANIAHDASTDEETLKKDYEKMISMLYDFVDFFVINASYSELYTHSRLEDPAILSEVMDAVLDKRSDMDVIKPVLIKISPDIPLEQLDDIIHYSLSSGVDGFVVGDGMRNRKGLLGGRHDGDIGFVCGTPLFDKVLNLVKHVRDASKGKLTIIASGGIMSGEDASAMLEAGASLVEIMSSFIYDGPKTVKKILKQLDNESK